MTDIERRLRDLGERVRDEQGPSAIPPNTIRAAKRRRVGTALTGLVTVAAIIFGATFAAGAFSPERAQIGPAQETSEVLIEYLRSGGFEDSDARLTVDRDGDSVLHYTERTVGLTVEGTLSQAELADVESVIAAIDWPAIDGSHDPAAGVGVADGYEYEIRYLDFSVTTVSGAEPREIKPMIELLDAFIAKERTDLERSERPNCGPPVDFEPTYVPEGWPKDLQRGPGAGGRGYPGLVGHYGEVEIGYYDLAIGAPLAQSNKRAIEVLGRRATSGTIHEGLSVEFEHAGCDYSLIAYVFDRSELERFAESLRLEERGEGSASRENFAAVWPEDNYPDASRACRAAMEGGAANNVRYDPESVALEFGALVLGWEEPGVAEVDNLDAYDYDGVVLELQRDPFGGDQSPVVRVWTFEVQPDCWSIYTVQRMPGDQPKQDGSMRVRGRGVTAGFDMTGTSSATFEVGHGGEVTRYEWAQGEEMPLVFVLTYEPHGPGHYLVLLRDSSGAVFSAFGSPLPEGDFAAG